MEIVKKNIVITFDELRILLYSQGFRRCEGVYMPEKDFSQQDIIRALKKLEESGLLMVGKAEPQADALPLVFNTDPEEEEEGPGILEEEFFIRNDLLEMIRIIGEPDGTEIMRIDPRTRIFCYYSEKGVVTSQRYPGRIEYVRLTAYSAEEFEQWRDEFEETELFSTTLEEPL